MCWCADKQLLTHSPKPLNPPLAAGSMKKRPPFLNALIPRRWSMQMTGCAVRDKWLNCCNSYVFSATISTHTSRIATNTGHSFLKVGGYPSWIMIAVGRRKPHDFPRVSINTSEQNIKTGCSCIFLESWQWQFWCFVIAVNWVTGNFWHNFEFHCTGFGQACDIYIICTVPLQHFCDSNTLISATGIITIITSRRKHYL